MKITNYIKINDKYIRLDEMPEEQKRVVSQKILDRLSEGMGYKKECEKAI